MKNYLNLMFALLAISIFMTSCGREEAEGTDAYFETVEPHSEEGDIIPGQYIVMFKKDFIKPASAYLGGKTFDDREEKGAFILSYQSAIENDIASFLAGHQISTEKILHQYFVEQAGVAINLTEEEFQRVSTSPDVEAVEHDRAVSLPEQKVENIVEADTRAPQVVPCGVTNAGGFAAAGGATWIWVVDTGIDMDHPDLNVITHTAFARSFVGGTAEDCNGHGTHCAGTAAAKNNSIGVVGVAANAWVVPVRVLNCAGSGSHSGIIAGLEHVQIYSISGDVVNMSLGGYYGSGCSSYSSYKSVVQGLGNSGVWVAIAAGNDSANAAYYQPACINGSRVYSIASMNCNKTWASTSNYNMNPVDYIATGNSVYSTYLNGGYATLSGTSMATPHVAGICQLKNSSPSVGGYISRGGEWYPIATR